MKYSVIITPAAENNLRTIYRYIRKHAPLAASAWIRVREAPSKLLLRLPHAAGTGKLNTLTGDMAEIRELITYKKSSASTSRPCSKSQIDLNGAEPA